jgi:hypothetical protein
MIASHCLTTRKKPTFNLLYKPNLVATFHILPHDNFQFAQHRIETSKNNFRNWAKEKLVNAVLFGQWTKNNTDKTNKVSLVLKMNWNEQCAFFDSPTSTDPSQVGQLGSK